MHLCKIRNRHLTNTHNTGIRKASFQVLQVHSFCCWIKRRNPVYCIASLCAFHYLSFNLGVTGAIPCSSEVKSCLASCNLITIFRIYSRLSRSQHMTCIMFSWFFVPYPHWQPTYPFNPCKPQVPDVSAMLFVLWLGTSNLKRPCFG